MFNEHRKSLHKNYIAAREYFVKNPNELIEIEHFLTTEVESIVRNNFGEFEEDYNEASFTYPFWGEYPPEERGRQPVGDQIPWIEVGEHSVGHKLSRLLNQKFSIREKGLPSGADDRFLLTSKELRSVSKITSSVMLFMDVKSVGPRDNFEHIVVSPYQVSGDGIWTNWQRNMKNTQLTATGKRTSHSFFPAIPPLYVFSDGTIAPVVHIFIKPIYKMLTQLTPPMTGQPLEKIRIITLPNGLLLTQNPGYLQSYPELLFPGKDDKTVLPSKRRCRVAFDKLTDIATWRCIEIP